jgi:hypothetical protein
MAQKEIGQGSKFLEELRTISGETSRIIIPDDRTIQGIFTNWRIEKISQFGDRPALVMDCISLDGEATEMFEDVDGQKKFPTLTISSVRFMRKIDPIVEKAINVGEGQINIKIKKILGKTDTQNDYEITEIEQEKEETTVKEEKPKTTKKEKPKETPKEEKPKETPKEEKPKETPKEEKPKETPKEEKKEEITEKEVEDVVSQVEKKKETTEKEEKPKETTKEEKKLEPSGEKIKLTCVNCDKPDSVPDEESLGIWKCSACGHMGYIKEDRPK